MYLPLQFSRLGLIQPHWKTITPQNQYTHPFLYTFLPVTTGPCSSPRWSKTHLLWSSQGLIFFHFFTVNARAFTCFSNLSHLKSKVSANSTYSSAIFPSPSQPTFLADRLHLPTPEGTQVWVLPPGLTDASRSPATSMQPHLQFSPQRDLLPAPVHLPPSRKACLPLGSLNHTHLSSSASQALPSSALLALLRRKFCRAQS